MFKIIQDLLKNLDSLKKADLRMIPVPHDVTDQEIKDSIAVLLPVVLKLQCPFVASISGYDDDTRELQDIPEAVSLCQRLVRLGFISMLEYSTTFQLQEKPYYDSALGALEIWLLTQGKYRPGFDITQKVLLKFNGILEQSNQAAEFFLSKGN